MKTALYIDGTGVFFRGYYGLPPLKNSKNQTLQGIIGFFNIIFRTLETYNPDYFVICFDRSEETQRKKEYPDYKANRSKAPDDLYAQMVILKTLLQSSNFNYLDMAGFEADDLIATLNKKNQQIENHLIYSSDLDLLQLTTSNTKIIKPQNGSKPDIIFTPELVLEKYEIHPHQITDYKGLHGDSSDNLKGIPGVGKKTATKLINEYQSLENIYENIENLKGKMKEKFEENKEVAFMCKRLATLIEDLDVPSIESFKFDGIDTEKLQTMFAELELNKASQNLKKLIKQHPEMENNQSQLF